MTRRSHFSHLARGGGLLDLAVRLVSVRGHAVVVIGVAGHVLVVGERGHGAVCFSETKLALYFSL